MDRPGLAGIELARGFHRDVVGPLLARETPGLRYAAGRLGSGSDVLGFDDDMSRDHDWGCRLVVLVDEIDGGRIEKIRRLLERELPENYMGMPVRFPTTWDPIAGHKVEVATANGFAESRLGLMPRPELSAVEWLTLTGQSILEVTAGSIFHDTTSETEQVRRWLGWYPPDVERYVLASAWQRVSQQLPFVGRTAERDQECQSRLLSLRLTEDLMRITFLLHRQWAPYAKWFEKAFRILPDADLLAEPLSATTDGDWRVRERGLGAAARELLRLQRELGFATPDTGVVAFWNRPYLTIAPEVSQALLAEVTDPELTALPPGIGSIDQWVDNTDVLSHPGRRRAVMVTYRAWLGK